MAAEIIHVPAPCINRVRKLREVPCQDRLASCNRSDLDLISAGALLDGSGPPVHRRTGQRASAGFRLGATPPL
jgi:hypothetical protein